MSSSPARWQLRFNQFEKAYLLLEEAIKINQPSVVERAGLIRFFEMSFELACKLLKDYEEQEGFVVKSPRDVIKQAFQSGYISRGHDWLEALSDRNLVTHTYDEAIALSLEHKIKSTYHHCLGELYRSFL